MRDGSVIPYIDKCTHLGNILCISDRHVMMDSSLKKINYRLIILFADFFHCNSNTFSTLFNSYCKNVYGCQSWQFNGKHINIFVYCMKKTNTKNLVDSFQKS